MSTPLDTIIILIILDLEIVYLLQSLKNLSLLRQTINDKIKIKCDKEIKWNKTNAKPLRAIILFWDYLVYKDNNGCVNNLHRVAHSTNLHLVTKMG